MKKRAPCSYPVKQGAETPPSFSAQRKRLANCFWGAYLLHLHSVRGRLVKRSLNNPPNYLKCLPVCNGKQAPLQEAAPLDLSAKKADTPPSSPQKPPPATTWKPLGATPGLVKNLVGGAKSEKVEWFPFVPKEAPQEKVEFFPLAKSGAGRKFPWTNSLNRIFLQEKLSAAAAATEGGESDAKGSPASPDSKPAGEYPLEILFGSWGVGSKASLQASLTIVFPNF